MLTEWLHIWALSAAHLRSSPLSPSFVESTVRRVAVVHLIGSYRWFNAYCDLACPLVLTSFAMKKKERTAAQLFDGCGNSWPGVFDEDNCIFESGEGLERPRI